MISPSNYWTMRMLSIKTDSESVSDKEIHKVKEFFKLQFPYLSSKTILSVEENKQIQTVLWEMFRFADDAYQRANAGLCLRCYISHRIFITCKIIPHIYNASAEKLFSYTNLLPLVLNDDGRTLVILGSDGKTQHILNHHNGTIQPIPKGGEFFSVVILKKFNPNLASNESLNNWIKRLTCQNKNIKSFLWQFGLGAPSDWGFLCKSIPRCLSELISKEDREIVKAFQTVYQRDRLKTHQKGRCSEPTQNQVQEILSLLQQKNITIPSKELISHLKRIADILREDWLYKKIGITKTIPIDVYNSSTNNYFPNPELIHRDRDPEDAELEKLQEMCEKLFDQALSQTITEVIQQRIEELEKSRGYKNFAQQFPEGLRLYYQENLSLGEIGKIWGIEWSRARRILKLENFLDIVQYRTEKIFLEKLLQSFSQSTKISHEPEYLKNLAESIREFTFIKVFQQAKKELMPGKKQIKNSLVAQIIRNRLMICLN